MATQTWIYPALIAVLGQNRRPSFAEMRNFVRRARREAAASGSEAACRGRCVVWSRRLWGGVPGLTTKE